MQWTPNSFSKYLALAFVLIFVASCNSPDDSEKLTPSDTPDVLSLVNPFVGTGGHGHTYPGATTPFGMVQLSPDTRLEGWDGCSGYHFTDSVIYGFSHTHLSGTGVSDYGDILLMPNTGKVEFNNGAQSGADSGYSSRFVKSSEQASPGYYTVHLEDYDIAVELTATARAGMHRYGFNNAPGHVLIDLEHRDQLIDFDLQQSGRNEVSGYRISNAWAEEQHVYFVAQFSENITALSFNNERTKVSVHFSPRDTLLVKLGISAVSIKNARENLEAEIAHWDFDRVRAETESAWCNQLQKIEVKGGTHEQKGVFYSALYHTMLAPNTWSDVNGQYRGMDKQIHEADHTVYTVFSLWDTFRALHPLFTIIERERTLDFLKTFLLHYEQGGRLPVWELAANETDCMIGYHSVPVVTDAFVKGITGFDAHHMLEAMIDVSTMEHFGLESYLHNGCILAADEPESVSKTLEYAYDDWCIAEFARHQGDTAGYLEYASRAQYYKNLFDPSSRFFRARMDGSWFSPFDPAEVNYNYTEANAWQYSLFVPQDISGLMALHGGENQLEKHLDQLFSASSQTTGRDQADITGLIGQYAHGNEPSHHMAYLYNFTGQPWKTQQRVRQIMEEMYSTQPDGLSGNEDCGQMSAWYVFSAMGFYPVTPGLPEYVIGSPFFDEVSIHLENGQTARITTEGSGPYIQSARLNDRSFNQSVIQHKDIMNGGHFHFEMGKNPNKDWAIQLRDRPNTSIDAPPIAPVPFFESRSATFTDTITVALGCINSLVDVFYRINDGVAQRYADPFLLSEGTTLEAWAVLPGGAESQRIKNTWHKIDGNRKITLYTEFANQYAAGGQNALIDFLRGSENYQTGRWQGYQGQDFEAVVDLGELQFVNRVAIGFLQDIKSWIWFPPQLEIQVSTDGERFETIAQLAHDIPSNQYGGTIRDFEAPVHREIRFVKITALNFGPCPNWHLGAGGESWLFADEIVVE